MSESEPRIVSGVGVMAFSLENPHVADIVEAAMAQAVKECLAAGVSIEDSTTIKAAMLEARRLVLQQFGLSDE